MSDTKAHACSMSSVVTMGDNTYCWTCGNRLAGPYSWLDAIVDKVRREALEEAAKLCGELAEARNEAGRQNERELRFEAAGLWFEAAAALEYGAGRIRALISGGGTK